MSVELWRDALDTLEKGDSRGRHGAPPLVRYITTSKNKRNAIGVVICDLESVFIVVSRCPFYHAPIQNKTLGLTLWMQA